MKAKPIILTALLLSSCQTYPSQQSVDNIVLNYIQPQTITIIGETHKKPESVSWFEQLIHKALKQHPCLTIALEIASDQQPKLDAIIKGQATVQDIEISPPIDHPDYREMLEQLAILKQQGACTRLIAIDSGDNNPINRDKWMAAQLQEHYSSVPVIALLGSLHTLKAVSWRIATNPQKVAGILQAKGMTVHTIPQIWQLDHCKFLSPTKVYIDAHEHEAVTLLNDELGSLLNAEPYDTANGVVDGFILWQCKD